MKTKLPKPSLFHQAGRAKPWGVRIRVNGKYIPSYFATEKERDQRAAEMAKEIAAEEKPFSPEERSWIRVIRSAARSSQVPERDISTWLFSMLSDRSKDDVKKATAGLTPTTPELAPTLRNWLELMNKRNLRARTLEGYTRFLTFFVTEIGVDQVGELERKRIISWITSRYTTESSRMTLRNYLVPFLSWCAEQGWLSRDVFSRLKWPKVHEDEKNLSWASPEVVSKLLHWASPDIRPAIVLGAFAGIRPTECQRVRWEDINFATRQINLPGTATKKRRPRLLYDMPEVLWEWLALVPASSRTGRVYPKGERAWRRDFAGAVKKAGLFPWPQDALRKGFATHGAVLKGRDWTVNIMGHVDERLLDAVYRGAVTRETAERYFKIRPSDETITTPPAHPERSSKCKPITRD